MTRHYLAMARRDIVSQITELIAPVNPLFFPLFKRKRKSTCLVDLNQKPAFCSTEGALT